MTTLATLALRFATSRPVIACAQRWTRAGAIAQGPSDARGVALTFDDGPDPRWTPGVLDALAAANARATFFFVGAAAAQHPALVERAASEGHTIGTHLWTHRRDTVDDEARFTDELARSEDCLHRLTNAPVRFLRYPYGRAGAQNPRALAARGFVAVHWTLSSHDTRLADPAAIVARVAVGLRPGAILLFHDAIADETHAPVRPPYQSTRDATARALPAILAAMRARGLDALTLDELLPAPATTA